MLYQNLCQTYSDVYKDFHGERPPEGHGMTAVEMLEQIDLYKKFIKEDMEAINQMMEKETN
tara:strand:+ start:309 stop:491 length:183 start_codon:yes stop_codon:yes gene_type:complete